MKETASPTVVRFLTSSSGMRTSNFSSAATTTSTDKKPSPAQEAMYERERACGTEWKEAKAAGKVKAGMKWPQYWSECNKRMKAAGK